MQTDTYTLPPDPRRKIQDINQFVRWYHEGISYQEMADRWMSENNDTITPTAFSNLRIKLGLGPRLAQHDRDLVPWDVREEHLGLLPMRMFHIRTRKDKRLPVSPDHLQRYADWERMLSEGNLVVHYEPDTDEGFFYVPAREGIDNGLIREPFVGDD